MLEKICSCFQFLTEDICCNSSVSAQASHISCLAAIQQTDANCLNDLSSRRRTA